MAERTQYVSDFSGEEIKGDRIIVEFKKIGADGKLDPMFGVFVLDADPEDKEVKLALREGRALSMRGRRRKLPEDL